MSRLVRPGTAIVLMVPAVPVWNYGLRPHGLTVGRLLILLAAALLAWQWRRMPSPRASLPHAVWAMIFGVTALWAWIVVSAVSWGCGTCNGDLYGATELGAVCVLTAAACALEPALRRMVIHAVFVGGVLIAVLALAGVHGLTVGTADASTVQRRLAGTFGNPNALATALAFSFPAGIATLRCTRGWLRLACAALLVLVAVALALTLSRSGMIAAVAGVAVLLTLSQPLRSRRRRALLGGLLAIAVAAAAAYPLFNSAREHAESAPIDKMLRSRDTSGWDGTQAGLVRVGGSRLSNTADGSLEILTTHARQGVSRSIGGVARDGTYAVTFQARAVSGTPKLDFGLASATGRGASATRAVHLSGRWKLLRIVWHPTANTPGAAFSAWLPRGSSGFRLRNLTATARPQVTQTVPRFDLSTRLTGSVYDELKHQQALQQKRDVESRLFAVKESIAAFMSQTMRGIGWDNFTAYSASHGNYGDLPTHDAYLQLLAELGLIGVLLFIRMLLVVVRAVRAGPRDELGLATLSLLVTGGVGLLFINGLVEPDVMLPLAFTAALACSRASVYETETEPTWWIARPSRWLSALPSLHVPSLLWLRAARLRALPTLAPQDTSVANSTLPDASGVPSPPRGYRPALDGLRAVAVMAVIAYHQSMGVPGGFLGVDVFFVLSGYLITSILISDVVATGRVRFANFWARRARRLLPAVILLVLVCAIEVNGSSDVSSWALRRSDLISTLFYYANWHFIATDQSYFASFLGSSPVRHTWTLAIEEQFYIVWPLIVFVAYRMGRSMRSLAIIVAVGGVASAVAMALLYSPADPSRSYFGTDTRAATLLVGAGLALLVSTRPGILRFKRAATVARWGWAPLAATVLAAFMFLPDHSRLYYYGGALVFAIVVAICLFILEAAPSGPLATALSSRPIRWIGRLSYSLYLWHWPIIVWMGKTFPHHATLRKVVELAVTFAASIISYYVVEMPIRTGRMPWIRLSWRRLALAMPAALAAVTVAIILLTTSHNSLATELQPVTPLACPRSLAVVGQHSWCVREIGKPDAPIVASIGDSTSQALYPGMRAAAKRDGWTYIEAAEGGCSILPLTFVESDQAQYISQAKQCAADVPPDHR